MNMYKNAVRALGAAMLLLAVVACEEEFGDSGVGIVDKVNFETNVADGLDVVAYSMNYPDGVQTNGLPVGVIGVYNDPVYGSTNASLLSQVTLSRNDPSFGDNPNLNKAVFTLPFFSRITDTDEEGASTYELDSIFRNTGPFKLTGYRSDFFLNDLDPDTDFEEQAVYYSNDLSNFNGTEGDILFETEVNPSAEEIVVMTPSLDEDGQPILDGNGEAVMEVSERLSPALKIDLDLEYWTENIIEKEGDAVFLNQNAFNDYFRGIYLKVEPIADEGNFILFNIEGANIRLEYTFEGNDDSGEPGELNDDGEGTLEINLGGVRVTNYDNNFGLGQTQIGEVGFNSSQDTTQGETSIFLKGGDGSIGIIELFGSDFDVDGIPDQLEVLRSCGIIINEANLTFFVDQDALGEGSGTLEPERVFVYDFDNNRVLVDGVVDSSVGNDGPVSVQTNHLGRLTRSIEGDQTSGGVSYRVRLTQHINNIVKNDSTNVKLAIGVSQNVLVNNSSIIRGTGDAEEALRTSLSSVISPEGTILHGNLSDNEAKRLKLRIYYTLTDDIDPNSPCGQILGLE